MNVLVKTIGVLSLTIFCSLSQASPLFDAVKDGNLEKIEQLISDGVEINADNDDAYTALHLAAKTTENPAVIEALVRAGADVDARRSYKSYRSGDYFFKIDSSETALHLAARYNENPAVIEALIRMGAKVNARDNDGGTALHWAAETNEDPAVIELLIKAGVKINAKNNGGLTALHVATKNNKNPAVIELLIKAGSKINCRAINHAFDNEDLNQETIELLYEFSVVKDCDE